MVVLFFLIVLSNTCYLYYNLVSYNYVANNPIKYIDPDGREQLLGFDGVPLYEPFSGEVPDCPNCDPDVPLMQEVLITATRTFGEPRNIEEQIAFGKLIEEMQAKEKAEMFHYVDNITGGDAVTVDNTFVQLFAGPEDVVLIGGAKLFAIVPFIIRADSKIVRIKNAALAGKAHPKTGVPFNAKGFPDFTKYLYKNGPNDVIISPTGDKIKDAMAANVKAGYKETPKGYTWHHHQDTGRMQLVERDVHKATGHTGGWSLWPW